MGDPEVCGAHASHQSGILNFEKGARMKAIVTGANRGIGLAIVKGLLAEGYEVVALCRETSSELSDLDVQVIENIDVTNSESVDKVFEILKDDQFDLLVNNAGIWTDEVWGELRENDFKSMRKALEVNLFGQLRATEAFTPLMKSGSKIVFITSRMGSIGDNMQGGRYGYRVSKAALNMAAKSLSVDLKSQKIAVAVLHPGFVKTRMVDFRGHISPEEAAKGLLQRIQNLNLENSGSFWHANGEELPW
jgi:NAD(P)-dependent dehydrogenase (short-subunit alcohol dehydrogenase family)